MVGKCRNAQPALIQHLARRIGIIIWDTDNSGTRVHQVSGAAVIEALTVTEENNGVAPAETLERRRLVSGDCFGICQLTHYCSSSVSGLIRADPKSFGQTCRR